MRTLFLTLLLFCSANSYGQNQPSWPPANVANQQQPVSTTRYLAGAFVGSQFGFGLGHAIQGRWKKSGWLYTAGETLALATAIYGYEMCSGYHQSPACEDNAPAKLALAAFVGIRLVETIDVFILGGDIFKDNQHSYQGSSAPSSFYILPSIATDKVGLTFGFSF